MNALHTIRLRNAEPGDVLDADTVAALAGGWSPTVWRFGPAESCIRSVVTDADTEMSTVTYTDGTVVDAPADERLTVGRTHRS